MRIRLLVALFALLAASGCATRITDDVLNRMTLCGAGYEAALDGGLEAKIGQDLREGGKITASGKDSLKAAFNKASLSDASYQSYLQCVEAEK